MLKNYFTIALRSLWKNKGYSTINILGLAVGLATCLLILLYVRDELSYDRYNEKADRIYRVDGDIQFGGNHFILATASDPFGPTVKKDYPQVEQFTRMRNYGGFSIKKENSNIQEDKVIYADSTLFDVFTLPMIQGDAKTALTDPNSVVITEKIALKYFNSTDVVGRNFIINDTGNLKITGVIKNMPVQSHFNFDFFVSLSSSSESRAGIWVSNNFNTYIVLKKGADPKALEARFDGMLTKYMGPQVKELMNISIDDFNKSGNWVRASLTPLTRIHLHSNKESELSANGSIQYVYIFSAIALLILIIACINFMNLSTARSSNRAREVGVRKVLGSMRKSLVYQFLTESLLISFIALLLALAIASLLLPYFNELACKEISIGLFSKAWLLPSLLLLVVIVGLLAGIYPAFFLSAFKPIEVLKGKLSTGFKTGWLRSSLVVVQFIISIFLIVGTVVIYNQLNYIRNKDLGFNREQVLIIQNTDPLGKQARSFKDEVLGFPGIVSATMTGYLPTNGWRSDSPVFPDAVPDQKKAISMQIWRIDENYITTLGMKMAQGRNFSSEFPTDSSGIIINEAAAKLLGMKDVVNKSLYFTRDFPKKNLTPFHIVGVVKDFNFNSLHKQVTPLALMYKVQQSNIAFRINTKNIPGLLSKIEDKWRTMAPSQPFSYSFMDDDFNNLYNAEQRIGKIFISFAALAIFIACLGLFGLVTFAAEQRTREIGIRKVLGASVTSIVQMLAVDFLKLVIVASFISFPFAWWAMNKWLEDFAYRISISWWIFLAAALTAVIVALATVSFQAIKAAVMNPVKSLRTE